MIVYVGLQLPAPNYPQAIEPQEIKVFDREQDANQWQRDLKITATSPTRRIYRREIDR